MAVHPPFLFAHFSNLIMESDWIIVVIFVILHFVFVVAGPQISRHRSAFVIGELRRRFGFDVDGVLFLAGAKSLYQLRVCLAPFR